MTEQLLERGDRVAATARQPQALADLADKFGSQLWTAALDVTDTAQLRETVDRAFADLGTIDVIVSNAGYAEFGAAEELSDTSIDRQLATNLTGPIHLTRAVVPHLRQQGRGRIIQLSSVGGQIAMAGLSLYHTSKWGIEGFFEAVGPEIAPFGIETTLIEPGTAASDFAERSMVTAPAIDFYADGPAGQHRQYVTTPGAVNAGALSDAAMMAAAIIASTEITPAPKRLALGSDAYTMIQTALAERLAALEATKDMSFSTDLAKPSA
jgi:NAD(P)-dependent dehydrogenase (short-subunit alcohol dehydrogenase family)